jgi:hypothetical protein
MRSSVDLCFNQLEDSFYFNLPKEKGNRGEKVHIEPE